MSRYAEKMFGRIERLKREFDVGFTDSSKTDTAKFMTMYELFQGYHDNDRGTVSHQRRRHRIRRRLRLIFGIRPEVFFLVTQTVSVSGLNEMREEFIKRLEQWAANTTFSMELKYAASICWEEPLNRLTSSRRPFIGQIDARSTADEPTASPQETDCCPSDLDIEELWQSTPDLRQQVLSPNRQAQPAPVVGHQGRSTSTFDMSPTCAHEPLDSTFQMDLPTFTPTSTFDMSSTCTDEPLDSTSLLDLPPHTQFPSLGIQAQPAHILTVKTQSSTLDMSFPTMDLQSSSTAGLPEHSGMLPFVPYQQTQQSIPTQNREVPNAGSGMRLSQHNIDICRRCTNN